MACTRVSSNLLANFAYVLIILGVGCVISYHAFVPEKTYFHRATTADYDLDRDVDFRITVITIDRANSLNKTLHSLNELLLDGDRTILEIWIDVDRRGRLKKATEQVARSFRWRKGPTRLHVQPHNVGIIGQWIDTWIPRPGSHEIGLIVEDDVDVSPMAYRWLKAVHREMASRTDFAGATLTSGQNKVLSPKPKQPFAAPKNDTIFMYKCFGTYGFSPNPEYWRRFQASPVHNRPIYYSRTFIHTKCLMGSVEVAWALTRYAVTKRQRKSNVGDLSLFSVY